MHTLSDSGGSEEGASEGVLADGAHSRLPLESVSPELRVPSMVHTEALREFASIFTE